MVVDPVHEIGHYLTGGALLSRPSRLTDPLEIGVAEPLADQNSTSGARSAPSEASK